MAYNPTIEGGISGFGRLRRRARQTFPQNLDINSLPDNRAVRINSRDYVQTSGSSIGLQIRPRQITTSTGDVIGAEISPRVAGSVGAGALIALRADPLLQAGSGGTVSAVRAIETNIDFSDSDSRTVTNDVTGWRVFPDFGTVTVSGKKSVILCATPNAGTWDYLIDFEASSGLFDATNGTYSTADGFIKIRVPEGDARLPYFLGTD